jgi:16S rRNA (adenine1518-N6/adenine1519-N6)-dimethyltransferase
LVETRRLLRRSGLRAKKGLGQHFLIDEEVLRRIISAAELSRADTVIEVGPGLGILTRELAERAGRVFAIELDSKLAAMLEETLASAKNVTIVNQDILQVDPLALLTEHTGSPTSYKVVANLPYYIASPVLRHFLEASAKPNMILVMVQKEVAQEIAAKPGRMSLLSIAVQLYGRPEIVGYVPAESFYPPPEVDSAILKIVVYSEPAVEVDDTDSFFTLVRAGFSAARKQLPNSLAQGLGLSKAEVIPWLQQAGIALERRAETLTLEEWACLWRIFRQSGRPGC